MLVGLSFAWCSVSIWCDSGCYESCRCFVGVSRMSCRFLGIICSYTRSSFLGWARLVRCSSFNNMELSRSRLLLHSCSKFSALLIALACFIMIASILSSREHISLVKFSFSKWSGVLIAGACVFNVASI